MHWLSKHQYYEFSEIQTGAEAYYLQCPNKLLCCLKFSACII